MIGRRQEMGRGFSRVIALVACTALLIGSGEGGNVAAANTPPPVRPRQHQPVSPPVQQWDAASVTEGSGAPDRGNRDRSISLRQQYPLRAEQPEPQPEPNEAWLEPGPSAGVDGFDAQTSVELADRRTEHTRVYANADGTHTTAISEAPLNFRGPSGIWAPIQTGLVPTAGGWRNAAGPVDIRVAAQANGPALVQLRLGGGQSLAYSLAAAAPVGGVVNGSTVTFAGALPHTDLELELGHGAVKETLVLASPAAPSSFSFPLSLSGLRAVAADDGRIEFVDGSGHERAVIPAGFMFDAAGATSYGVAYRLTVVSGRPVLELRPDPSWLADPARHYPVRVDPSVQWRAADSTMVVQGGSSRAGGAELLVGPIGGATASYLKFGSLVNALRYHTVYGAQLSIVEYDSPSCRPRPMSVHPVTQTWTAGSGYSYPGPAVGGAMASKSFAYGHIALGQSRSACPADRVLFDLGRAGRDLVQGWLDGGANNGLSLRAPISDPLAWKRIAGATTANPPTLYVTHSPYNADYTIPNPVPSPPVLQNQAGKVKVTVTNKGAEAWSPSNYYLAYRAYDTATHRLVTQRRSAGLPGTLARGARVTVEATIYALPPGKYYLDFTMVRVGGKVFTDEQVPPGRIVLRVIDIPPVLQELYPPNGYQAQTLTPQLWARAIDIDAPPGSTMRFGFVVCELSSSGTRVNCLDSGDLAAQAWTVPAGRLYWSKSYQWQARVKDGSNTVTSEWVNLLTSVPQPVITGLLAGAPYATPGKEFDPQVGNYSTAAVDASIGTVGPSLTVVRTYNSLDPRRDLAFGAGWSSQFDMRVVPDDDGSGNVVVTYSDGQQVRFGRNPDGTFAAPQGRTATLVVNGTSYVLSDRAGMVYQFTGTGRLGKITDAGQRSIVLTYDASGRLARAMVSNSQTNTAGRSLWFTWSGSHIASVRTDPVNGAAPAWNYTYEGDLLTKVCGPANDCAGYSYATGSHYRTAVLDSAPQSFWRLGEKEGTGAASEVAVNLGKDSGTYRSVTLGAAGAAGMGGNAAGTFNGTNSVLELPKGELKKSRDAAIELWFKISPTQTGGPLAGYQNAALASASSAGVPVLYVGTDGRLRGQFRTGAVAPVTSAATVNNNAWHHVVLSVMGGTQTLWLDGVRVGTLAAGVDQATMTFNQVGAAYASSPTSWPGWGATARRYFSGSIDEVAIYNHPLGQAAVTAHYRQGIAAADQLTSFRLPSGRIVSEVGYDTGLDRVKEYTDSNGGTWRLGVPAVYGGNDDLRRSVTVLDPAGRPHFYEYDALANRLLRTGIPSGLGTREEDLPGYPLPGPSPTPSPTKTCSTPDPGDPSFCTILPGDPGGPGFIRQPLDGMAIRTFTYDAKGFQKTVVNENGASVTFGHDDRGNITARTTCRTATQCFTHRYTYPATVTNPLDPRNDLPLDSRDGRSAGAADTTYRTTYTYTATGDLLTQTNPDGAIVRHTYTTGSEPAVGGGAMPPALVATTTDPRGAVTRYAYYANGDLARVTEPSGLVVNYGYDALGRKVSETELSDTFPAGVTTTYQYDSMSRLIAQVDPATTSAVTGTRHQRSTEHAYDADGNLVKVTERDLLGGDPARVATYEYDDLGRVRQVTDPEGNATSFDYDKFGNRVGVVDANGNEYRYAYTARNALSEVRLRDWNGDPPGAPQGPQSGDYMVLDSYAYDLAGRMVRHSDAMGRRVEYGYYHDDLMSSITLKAMRNPDGTTRDYVLSAKTYDGAGNLIREVAGNGTTVTEHTITRTGQIATTTVNPGGLNRRTAFTYDLAGNVTSTTRSGNASNVAWAVPTASAMVSYNYDTAGNMVRETVGTGATATVTTHRYDQRGMQIATTDPRGNVTGADPAAYTTTFHHDEHGQQTSITSPPVSMERSGGAPETGRPTFKFGYDAFGQLASTLDELGRTSSSNYDRLGRLSRVTGAAYTPPGTVSTVQPTSSQRHDALGNVVEVIDRLGNATRYTYDRLNRVVTRDAPGATNNERAVWRYTYTRTGQVLSTTDPTGARVEATYDDLDRMLTLTRAERRPVADNFTTTYRYDDAGNLVRQTSPSGTVTVMAYDAVGDLVRSTDPHGVVTQYGYDLAGRQVRMSDGLGRTDRMDYDQSGRLTTQSDLSPSGAVLRRVSFVHDADGNLVSSTDGAGRVRTFAHDALDRLVRQVEPVSATKTITTTFGYDAAGNRTRYTDGRGNPTIYTYNSLSLAESVIEPATPAHPAAADRTWTVNYDAAGRAVKLAAPGNVTRQRTFDAAGRLTVEAGAGAGVTTAERRLGYDLSGRLVTSSAHGGTDAYTYNDRGEMLTATGPSGNASFGYDADGNLTSRTDKAGTSRFTYDRGRLATMSDGITNVTQGLGYDAAGQVRSVDYGAGRVRGYGFDGFGRLNSDTLRNSAGGTVSSVGYTFDIDDRMVRKVTTGTAGASDNVYSYDDTGRLISWTAQGVTVPYSWDDSGNRIGNGPETATYDARDRLLADGDSSYSYTARGTLASRTSGGQTEQYSFDAFDRLAASEGQNYSYDGQDRVARRGGTAFSYAGLDDDLVSDGTQNYARGPEGELLAMADGARKRIVLSDQHDDVVAAFDPADTALGGLRESRAYSPFGEVIAEAGDVQASLGFQGDYTDPDTDKVNMGARWYNPGTGSFMSRDSVDYRTGPSILANRYTYGAGDPLGHTDPDGHWPKISCGVCGKVKDAVTSGARAVRNTASRGYRAVRGAVSRGFSWARSGLRHAWSAVRWAGRQFTSAARWVYNRGRAAVGWVTSRISQAARWVSDRVSSAVRWVSDRVSAGYRAVRGAVSRGVSWARDRAEQVRRAAVAAARRVTETARSAVRWAVQHNPLPAIAAALKPVYSAMRTVVSAAAHIPAAVVSTVRNVVRDATRAVQVVYQRAVDAAGTVVQAVSTAAQAASEFAQAALPMVAGVAAGIVTTAGCLAITGGAGSAACVVAGFAAGSAVTSALSCPPGRSIAGCAVRGGAAGAVGGAVFVGTGGMGSGLTAAVVSGAASSGASSAAGQYLDTGEVSARSVMADAAVGAAVAPLGARGKGRPAARGNAQSRPAPRGHADVGIRTNLDEMSARDGYRVFADDEIVAHTGEPDLRAPSSHPSPWAPGSSGTPKWKRVSGPLARLFDQWTD